jgi:hypothetical protein
LSAKERASTWWTAQLQVDPRVRVIIRDHHGVAGLQGRATFDVVERLAWTVIVANETDPHEHGFRPIGERSGTSKRLSYSDRHFGFENGAKSLQ